MRIIVLFLSLLVFTLKSNAETSKISVESYGKLPEKSMFVISPSSERIAYRDTSNGRDIVIMTDMVKGEMLAAINVAAVKPKQMYFIDEDTLIFIASETRVIRGFQGRHEISAAFAYQLESKKMHQLLIQGNGIYKGQSQLGRI